MAACGGQGVETDPVDQALPAEEQVASDAPALNQAAIEMRDEILAITQRDSLRSFTRLAESTPGFSSNFSQVSHSEHWSLLRRLGVDPLGNIEGLFASPYAGRQVGDEYWYIWPDFAAYDAGTLVPERLSFQDRKRLLDLIGQDGMEAVRIRGVYPGVRTAISDTGRWVYYVHDIGESETEENE